MQKEDNSFGVLSVLFGILSIIFSLGLLIPAPIAGIIFGILGIIFSFQQKKRYKNSWSGAGLWLSIIGLVINVLLLIWIVKFINDLAAKLQELQQSGALDNPGALAQYQSP